MSNQLGGRKPLTLLEGDGRLTGGDEGFSKNEVDGFALLSL